MTTPFFVAIEGIDGSGKSTLALRIYRLLRMRGHQVTLTKEPYNLGDIGNGRAISVEEATLDRAHHVHDIITPAVERGDIIICDRYTASCAAYPKNSTERAREIFAEQSDLFPRPDMWIYIRTAAKVCQARCEARGERWDRVRMQNVNARMNNVLRTLEPMMLTVVDGATASAYFVCNDIEARREAKARYLAQPQRSLDFGKD